MGKSGTPDDSAMTAEQVEDLLVMIGELQEKASAVAARLARFGEAVRHRPSGDSKEGPWDEAPGTRQRDTSCLAADAGRQQQARQGTPRGCGLAGLPGPRHLALPASE
jgi:hypothetical protein